MSDEASPWISWYRRIRSVVSGPMVVRLLTFALTAALSTCHSPLRTSTPVPLATEPPAPRRFDPDVVRPDPSSPLGTLRAALDEDPRRALELVDELIAYAEGDEKARLAWVGARAAQRVGEGERAAALFAVAAETESPLEPWARLARGRTLLEIDPALAARELEPLGEQSWAGRRTARELRATALMRVGEKDPAIAIFQALLAESPSDAARASVAMPLAELLAEREEPEAKLEAVRLWRRVAASVPLSQVGRDAERRAAEAVGSFSPELREAVGELPPEEAFVRAEAIGNAMRHAEAAEAFAAVARSTDDEALRCRARLGQARALYRARERRRAAPLLASVADDCEEPDVRAWARYLSGRAFGALSDYEPALEQYAALEREVPDHRLADDARFRSALLDAARGEHTSMVERLSSLPATYPEGDMHGEARFLLAWQARREGRLEEALRYLEASVREGPGEDAEDLHGRAAYWHAVVLAELGRTDDARREWTNLVATHPLSYYSQQALVRLRELGPAAYESARASLGVPGEAAITFAWRDELDHPAFARAIELFKVGEIGEGRDELAWMRAESGAEDEELRWIEAALLDRVGEHPSAVFLARQVLASFRQHPPSGAHYARWRIAYPAAYAPMIERIAEERGLPAALIRAIAREESSFRPDAVSVAHAYGLVQLIEPTARRFARTLGLKATRRTLVEPETNVAIGSAFMRWLWDRYESNPAVLPSAYNAGQGATDRWLRARPEQRLDEWIEEIPYDETRRYTRRVLQSWGIYAWLDGGELPTLRAELPPAP